MRPPVAKALTHSAPPMQQPSTTRPTPVLSFTILTFLLSVTLSCASQQQDGRAQEEDVVGMGVVKHLTSTSLGERRTLNIFLPPGYEDDDTTAYPVIYLLDGAVDEDYHHVSGLVQFLTTYALMPPSILVGIANVDRYRDFTYPSTVAEDRERLPTSGGSEKFRQFLEAELQPFIEATYRTAPPKTLIGQSLGGLLATEIFIKTPTLFDNYIIVSPSLWWDNGTLVARVEESLVSHPERTGKVYVSVGTEGSEMEDGVDRLVEALRMHAPPGVTWYEAPFPEETHATILHRSLYRAFELFYGETYPGY